MYGNSPERQRVTTTVAEKEQSPSSQLCVRLREAAGKRAEAKGGGADRSGSLLAAPPVHPHTSRWLGTPLSCSSTSREGWEAPILSWQPSTAHSQSHIITTFIFISIDTRPFPPLKLNQRGCRKGREGRAGAGREGGFDDEMPAQATAHCIPICMQMVSCESRAYITRSEPGQRLRNNCNLPTRDTTLQAPWVTKMPAGSTHKSSARI